MARARAGAPLEVRWRLKGPSGRVFCCRIHRHSGSGFEVLTRYDGAFVRAQWVPVLEDARQLADAWEQTILAIGGFTALPGHAAPDTPPSMRQSRHS